MEIDHFNLNGNSSDKILNNNENERSYNYFNTLNDYSYTGSDKKSESRNKYYKRVNACNHKKANKK